MSETASFVDPVFLARFGLCRANAVDYFLHPLNPFRTSANTSNEVLAMQGITIAALMQHGTGHGGAASGGTGSGPLSPRAAEEEYAAALRRLAGEQYELLPAVDPAAYAQPGDLYTIRHVLRSTSLPGADAAASSGAAAAGAKLLGVYYIVQGVIYKSPPVRNIQKSHVTRVLTGLARAQRTLAPGARFLPSTGYLWVFDGENAAAAGQGKKRKREATAVSGAGAPQASTSMEGSDSDSDDSHSMDPVALLRLSRRLRDRQRRRLAADRRTPGQTRTAAEEEGIRAAEALDQILVRLSKSRLVAPPAAAAAATAERRDHDAKVAAQRHTVALN